MRRENVVAGELVEAALSSPNGTEPSGDQAKEHQLPLRASIPASWLVGLKYGIDSAA
jgi:hypothetical protein